jgi:hypothetical protein
MKYALKLFLLTFILFSIVGCRGFDDYKYETYSMVLSNADNTGLTPVDASGSAPRVAYAIKMLYSMRITESKDTDRYESGFHNEDEVSSFSVTSPDTFNMVPPNGTLNQFFNYSTGDGTGAVLSPENYTIIGSGGTSFSDNSEPDWTRSHYLLLMNPPDTTGNYSFIVDLTFSDGRQLIDSVNVILY